ncbi:5248_t:CDS:2, partial [Ambispora leptoticha]
LASALFQFYVTKDLSQSFVNPETDQEMAIQAQHHYIFASQLSSWTLKSPPGCDIKAS